MKLVKNVLLILIGLVIIGIGASTLRVAGLGVDPFTAMNIRTFLRCLVCN